MTPVPNPHTRGLSDTDTANAIAVRRMRMAKHCRLRWTSVEVLAKNVNCLQQNKNQVFACRAAQVPARSLI